MRRRPVLIAAAGAAALALVVGLVVVLGDDDPDEVATDATTTTEATTTTRRTTTTTTSTTTTVPPTTTSPPTTSPPTTSPPATTPPTTPPATTPPTPPPPPPPSNPRITTVTAADLGASWRSGCPVGPSQLRRISVTFRGFDGAAHTGSLIVRDRVAEDVLAVFDQIYDAGFAIQRIEPVSVYGASDDASMAANNTSAFNCRLTTNGSSWSRHSYGQAIDINPIQNPYILGSQVLPPASATGHYDTDRSARQGVIRAGDAVVTAFAGIGWQWGGNWTSPIDYQHFDIR